MQIAIVGHAEEHQVDTMIGIIRSIRVSEVSAQLDTVHTQSKTHFPSRGMQSVIRSALSHVDNCLLP